MLKTFVQNEKIEIGSVSTRSELLQLNKRSNRKGTAVLP